MKIRRLVKIFGLTWLGLLAWAACTPTLAPPTARPTSLPGTTSVEGAVYDADGPVSGAVVRAQTTDLATTTDAEGRFTFTDLTPSEPITLTAWAPGYYIAGGEPYLPGTDPITITLTAHTAEDNPNYAWLSAFAQAGDEGNCQNCHSNPDDPLSALPFDEWQRDAHSQSAVNPRFLTMYTGTDVHGNQSPLTRHGYSRDYGTFPLRPDPNRPYYGPGYKLDFPNTAGNCAACHAPAAAVNTPYGVDPTAVTGVGAEGVACDFCHKVWDVRLDSVTGLPYENMPGVLSFELRRPPEGHQFFAGPFDDVAPGEDTYSPLQRQSQFCAPCHFGVFWGTVVYNSFGEWLESPYSDPESGKTCQDCHMPSLGATHFARPDRGGHRRDPATIFSHRMPGASDEELLQNAVTMDVSAERRAGEVTITVTITNDKVGHHIPTDSPLRQMILLVRATDGQGQALSLLDGPTVPEWGGTGEPAAGATRRVAPYYAGSPGKAFAKVLEELWTEVSPSGAYWNPTRVLSDNRLAAFATDTSTYTFAAPDEGEVTVEVTLIFRRAFIELMEQKGWDVPDIVMARQTLVMTD